jgi:hypothetical protein
MGTQQGRGTTTYLPPYAAYREHILCAIHCFAEEQSVLVQVPSS